MTAQRGTRARLGLGLVLALLGGMCLNYTKAFDLEHHTEWATQHGLPPPSYEIFVTGLALLALGAGLVGHALGRRGPRGPGG